MWLLFYLNGMLVDIMASQQTFFFYDLETSGLDPKSQRIMQFAGIRTTMELEPIGEPVNCMIALSDEVLPDPGAIMVTGITPQQTVSEGYSEADFCRLIHNEVCVNDTIMVGFNNVRFDDEFMRYTLYRNFYDPYEWCWQDGRSRWDLLDVIRLTRAIRPEGIEWPVDDKNQPTNRLELLAKANGLEHSRAHDALSDVEALIALTKLTKTKQPKLYTYMLNMRDKNEVKKLVNVASPEAFVYASGRYDGAYQKTTLAYPIAESPRPGGGILVYDLRVDPSAFLTMNPRELADRLFAPTEERQQEGFESIPVKELSPNKCPAVAPAGVLDKAAQERLSVSVERAGAYIKLLKQHPQFSATLVEAFALRPAFATSTDCDAQLYDGFMNNSDKSKMAVVRAADRSELATLKLDFDDDRLQRLLIRYKARNYPSSLNDNEREAWEDYRLNRITNTLPRFVEQLKQIANQPNAKDKQFLLDELQLWAESIAPID